MTRITIAALPMVEKIDGASAPRLAKCGWGCGMLLTHSNDIASHGVPERKITGDCNKYIDESCNAYAGEDHTGGPEMRIISNLVENREHLVCTVR